MVLIIIFNFNLFIFILQSNLLNLIIYQHLIYPNFNNIPPKKFYFFKIFKYHFYLIFQNFLLDIQFNLFIQFFYHFNYLTIHLNLINILLILQHFISFDIKI